MQDIKIKNYKRLILSVFIGASLISIMQVTILQVLLTCFICFVVFDFLKKRKQNELGKCNHFVIECVIVTSFALSEILGNFIGIYNVHTCNFFGLGIALLCVILEGVSYLRIKSIIRLTAFEKPAFFICLLIVEHSYICTLVSQVDNWK